MMYMYHMARKLEKDLNKKQIEDIREIANKRIIFDDKIKSYTIIITDFIRIVWQRYSQIRKSYSQRRK